MQIGKGSFTPGVGHRLDGTFTLTRQASSVLMVTSNDFYFDGSPAPGWALTNDIPTDASDPKVRRDAIMTDFQRLTDKIESVQGQQSGLIPNSINIDEYDTVFLWCYQFPFILGFGQIERI